MKHLKFIILVAILLGLLSCEKVKLEDHEVGKILVGKWDHQMAGFHTSQLNFTSYSNSKEDHTIEFLEGGKLCINDNGESETYRIRRFSELEKHYGQWRYQVSYGKEKDKLNFQVHYYGEDSIMINKLPYVLEAPSPYVGLQVYRRVE